MCAFDRKPPPSAVRAAGPKSTRHAARTPPHVEDDAAPVPDGPGPGFDFARIAITPPPVPPRPDPGDPLDSPTRRRMEQRFGVALDAVRIHTSPAAANAARTLNAVAFTVGRDIALGANAPPLGTHAGQRLLSHEIAHAIQQGLRPAPPAAALAMTAPGDAVECQARNAADFGVRPTLGSAPFAVARQDQSPPPAPPPAGESIEALYRRFVAEREAVSAEASRETARILLGSPPQVASPDHGAEATQLARRIVSLLASPEDIFTYGIVTALWLQEHGDAAAAERAFTLVEREFQRAAAGSVQAAVTLAHGSRSSPDELIPRAEAAARSGDHVLAFRLFELAYLLLQAYLVDLTRAHDSEPRTLSGQELAPQAVATLESSTRPWDYSAVGGVYDRMRRILGFYRQLEGETHDPHMSGLGLLLHREIRQHYLFGDEARGMIASVSQTTTADGPGLTIHGANSADTDVTRLPGTPDPREVGAHSYQWSQMREMEQDLYDQTELMAELHREPAIMAAFPDGAIDMNDLQQRLRVWRILYGVYQARDTAGLGALHSLMALIGRYLRAFTVHTQYNIRDFGESYLDSPMAVDLAGRAERDCGVYAVMAAYELYRTGRDAQPRLDLSFELIALPDHVALIVQDHAAGNFYVVNNDEVSPAQTGDTLDVVRSPLHRDYLMTPGYRLPLGSTQDRDRAFRQRMWQTYLDSARWGFAQQPGDPDRDATYRRFYEAQGRFDQESTRLDTDMGALAARLAPLGSAARGSLLERELPGLFTRASALRSLFDTWARRPAITLDQRRRGIDQRMQGRDIYLYSTARQRAPHPMARVGMAFLLLERLGGTLDPAVQDFLAWMRGGSGEGARPPIPGFDRAIAEFERVGYPASLTVRVPDPPAATAP